MSKKYLISMLLILAVGTGVISRLTDHPANFAPIGAIALLSGFYLKSKWGWIIPIAAMLISDAFIGFYTVEVLASVYLSYVAIWGLGRLTSSSKTKWSVAPATLLGSSIHFVLTNAAVWAFTTIYPKTAAGLASSYIMAIPFFKWTVFGDVLYTGVFIALIEGIRYAATRSTGQMEESEVAVSIQ